jgi:hypothetical protein
MPGIFFLITNSSSPNATYDMFDLGVNGVSSQSSSNSKPYGYN